MGPPNLEKSPRTVSRLFKTVADALRLYLVSTNFRIIITIALSYFLTGLLGLHLANPDLGAVAVWLPSGIALAAILLRGNNLWPGIFIGAFLINVTDGLHVPSSLGIALSSTLEALGAAYLVNKWAHGRDAFFSPRDVLRFVFVAGMLAPTLCATFGVCVLRLGGFVSSADFVVVWRIWWVGDMLGTLLLTPFLVLLLGHRHQSLNLLELFEFAVLLIGLSVVCVLNFGPSRVPWIPKSGLHYLCVPFLAWTAVRFCPLEAAGASLVLGCFAMWGTLHGFGLFAGSIDFPFIGAGYVAVACTTTLTIAAAFAGQRKHLEDVLAKYYLLKEKHEGEVSVKRNSIHSSGSS